MSSTTTINASLPQPNIPFLDENGNVSRAWFYFLLSLFYRTGGPTPVIPAVLQKQINALFVQEAMNDVTDDGPPVSTAVLMADLFVDDAFRPLVNPFLAAFVVADIP